MVGNLRPSDTVISKWRREACFSGRHVEISSEAQQTLDVEVARELRDVEVGDYMTVANLQELARVVGVKRAGTKDELITRLRAVIQAINDTGTAVVSVGKGPIPWVLTDDEVLMVNNRFRRLVLPPHVHAFCTTEEGLFDDKSSCWRMISKMQVFMMLPVLLLGTVPAIHASLIKVVHGIMLLNGRVISERVRRDKRSHTCQLFADALPNPIPNVLCADIKRVYTTSALKTSLRLNCYCQRVCQSTLKQLHRLRIRHTCITSSIIRDLSTCSGR